MFLILISLIRGYTGMRIGSAYNFESALGFIGFLCPTLFVVQRIYIKINNLENDGYFNIRSNFNISEFGS